MNADCGFDGCERPAISRFQGSVDSYCRTHWQQLYNGKPLTPIRGYRRAGIKVNGKRQCTGCDEWKDAQDYYVRQTGVRQQRCVECMVQIAQVAQFLRNGRPREAARIILDMPDRLRKTYLDKYATIISEGV